MSRPQFNLKTLLWLTLVMAIGSAAATRSIDRRGIVPLCSSPILPEFLPDGTSLDDVRFDLRTDAWQPIGRFDTMTMHCPADD